MHDLVHYLDVRRPKPVRDIRQLSYCDSDDDRHHHDDDDDEGGSPELV